MLLPFLLLPAVGSLLLLLAPTFVVAYVPALLPMSLLYRLALGLCATNLLFALPLVDRLVSGGGGSEVVRTVVSWVSFLGVSVLSPSWLVRSFVLLVGSIGPLCTGAASAWLVRAVAVRLSRRWSRANGDQETLAEEEQTARYKAYILGSSVVCLALAVRWTYAFLTTATTAAAGVITVGHLVQAGAVWTIALVLIVRSLRVRRAVLSEACFVVALLTLALHQYGRWAATTSVGVDAGTGAGVGALPEENVYLDRWLPNVLDAFGLSLLVWKLLAAADTTDEGDEPAAEQRIGDKLRSAMSSSSSMLSLVRAGSVVVLLHLLQSHVWLVASSAAHHGGAWWTVAWDRLSSVAPQTVAAWMHGAGGVDIPAEVVDSAGLVLQVRAYLAHVSLVLAALFPIGLSALARAVVVTTVYWRQLRRDDEREDEPMAEDDEHED